LLIGCAARGIETAAGHVESVVTERGTIRCSTVVVAGGAWSRRLLKDVGIDLPQLKVLSSVARTSPIPDAPAAALWDDLFAFRRRADGGYTVANGRVTVVSVTPDSFRLAAAFLPALRLNWKAIRPRLDRRFGEELREAARVPFDRPSPYERVRMLDPTPHAGHLASALRELAKRFPAFAKARVLNSWGGYIDSTPDLVPVISRVGGVAGLVVATGFSGHGFGIGPGAGQLVADLVTGATPLVNPAAFRLGRYSDGSNPRPTMGL
jgi:glycine/D-amino acid oxidase-like deaminating enzyme